MTLLEMFTQLCHIANTLERLAQAQEEGSALQMRLEAVQYALDATIDEAVESGLYRTSCPQPEDT